MSESNTNTSHGGNGGVKRNLPSWMSAREEASKTAKAISSNQGSGSGSQEGGSEGHDRFREKAKSSATNISKLMEGVVIVLSGFVNPERGTLRSQALEMGAEYQPDWNLNCTLLVCAFSNTPKFRQVAADGGTIVTKEWISECFKQRQLVEIEPYLMHAGKPWKKQSDSHRKPSMSQKPQTHAVKGSHTKPSTSISSKGITSNGFEVHFSAARVKKWAMDDLKRTISWLENQDEKPEPGEIKKIAVEGILTFLQDTIDCLQQGQVIRNIMEQWACIPLVVEELAKFDDTSSLSSPGKEKLCKQAMACKQIYELEYSDANNYLSEMKKNPENNSSGKDESRYEALAKDDPSYDSDETVEMTEEEIDLAYSSVASTVEHANY